jgi:hypothetical protein
MPWIQIFFPLKGSDVALTLFEEFPCALQKSLLPCSNQMQLSQFAQEFVGNIIIPVLRVATVSSEEKRSMNLWNLSLVNREVKLGLCILFDSALIQL